MSVLERHHFYASVGLWWRGSPRAREILHSDWAPLRWQSAMEFQRLHLAMEETTCQLEWLKRRECIF